jgi:hypothetical protein
MMGMGGGGGMGGGQGGGHMVRCPLCGGSGVTTPEKAAAVAPMMQGGETGTDPAAALTAALTQRPKGGGGRGGGHGGGHGGM